MLGRGAARRRGALARLSGGAPSPIYHGQVPRPFLAILHGPLQHCAPEVQRALEARQQPAVLMVQLAVQARAPPPKPRLAHVLPPNSVPSHCSPGFRLPSPHL